MKKKTKILQKCLVFALMFIVAGAMLSTESYAYFQRGNVGVSVGKHNVTLNQGGSETVSVSFSPSSSRQLPGCGMAECPQTCGEKDCLDANGECKCNGTTYKTYYASASASSSNTSVATASCSGSSVVIKGVSAGTATITVTASLRQFTSTSTTISVTVNKSQAASSSGSASSGSGSSSGKDSSSGKVTAKKSAGDDSDKSKKNKKNTEAETKTVESDRGEITFVQIPDGKTGKKELESIKGEKEYVDFQKKDESDTILYAWEFLGTDLNEAKDIDLNLYFSREAFDSCAYGSADDSVYIKRGEEGAFPGKATAYIRVADWFKDGDKLNLYEYTKDGELGILEEELEVVNGYVTCSAMYGDENRYILSTEKWEAEAAEAKAEGGTPWTAIGAGAAVIVLAGAATVFYRKKKGTK